MKPLVAIPVKNRLDLTKPLVSALREQGANVLVYDNGSSDGTSEWLQSEGIPFVFAGEMTLHEMWNDAIERARSTEAHLVLLNNDLELDGKPEWIGRLCAPFESIEDWDVLCPNYDGSPSLSWRRVIRLRGICAGKEDWTGGLAGFAFAISNRFLKTGYRFPTDLKWWCGDNDLVRTLDEQHRPYGMVTGVGVTHIGGGSQTAKDHDLSEVMRKDMETYEKKWAVPK